MSQVSRWGVRGTELFGVFFTESSLPHAKTIKRATARSGRQNIGLVELKQQLAQQARAAGADAVANLRYQQRATVFSFSSIEWLAEGDLVSMPVGQGSSISAPSAEPAVQAAPGGWYANPTGQGQRYWD